MGQSIQTWTDAEYHSDPCPEPSLSASVAATLLTRTPLHAWAQHPRLNPDHVPQTSDAFDVGTVFHTLVTGHGPTVALVEADDWRSKAAREQRDLARAAGEVPMLERDMAPLRRMAAIAHDAADDIGLPPLSGSAWKREVPIAWHQGGVWNRCKPDLVDVERRVVVDLKSAVTADPAAWTRRNVGEYCADVRVAHYLDGCREAWLGTPFAGDDHRRWRYLFLVVEKAPPHAASVIEFDSRTLALGESRLDRARQRWQHCLGAGHWPAWPGVTETSAPEWVVSRHVMDLAATDEPIPAALTDEPTIRA